MKRTQPKKYLSKVRLKDEEFGYNRRLSYQKTILENSPIFPKTLEYDDIDNEFFKFVDKEIPVVCDGKLIPTFKLFSNQRFSEYSQTWQHTDENGNLYLNFKTINRDKNPGFGDNQGGLWRIPGNRRYMILSREVLDDNGTESYETYSMRQPYTVDLTYSINFITNTNENINKFNEQLNDLFSARQCYIRPNGHYLPMVVEDISDASNYSIEERRFFVQTVTIKVMAYIIKKDDFEIQRFPKQKHLYIHGDKAKKANIEISDLENKTMELKIEFDTYIKKTEFIIDCDMVINNEILDNIRNYRISVNGTPYFTEKGFKLYEGDIIKIYIRPIDELKPSCLTFIGYDENKFVGKDYVDDIVINEKNPTHETIIVDNSMSGH